MERLTQTSDKGGVAFTFDLDITCEPSEMQKILRLAEKLLFVTLPAPNPSQILQIKRRYSINYSDV